MKDLKHLTPPSPGVRLLVRPPPATSLTPVATDSHRNVCILCPWWSFDLASLNHRQALNRRCRRFLVWVEEFCIPSEFLLIYPLVWVEDSVALSMLIYMHSLLLTLSEISMSLSFSGKDDMLVRGLVCWREELVKLMHKCSNSTVLDTKCNAGIVYKCGSK
jgi:hypothetical protein